MYHGMILVNAVLLSWITFLIHFHNIFCYDLMFLFLLPRKTVLLSLLILVSKCRSIFNACPIRIFQFLLVHAFSDHYRLLLRAIFCCYRSLTIYWHDRSIYGAYLYGDSLLWLFFHVGWYTWWWGGRNFRPKIHMTLFFANYHF